MLECLTICFVMLSQDFASKLPLGLWEGLSIKHHWLRLGRLSNISGKKGKHHLVVLTE